MPKAQKKLSGVGKRMASPGNGQNRWTLDQKLTLRLMFVEFGLSAETGTTVFNRLYAVRMHQFSTSVVYILSSHRTI